MYKQIIYTRNYCVTHDLCNSHYYQKEQFYKNYICALFLSFVIFKIQGLQILKFFRGNFCMCNQTSFHSIAFFHHSIHLTKKEHQLYNIIIFIKIHDAIRKLAFYQKLKQSKKIKLLLLRSC